MKIRWKVACINWSHEGAPHAVTYLLEGDQVVFDRYFPTHAEALTFADRLARREES